MGLGVRNNGWWGGGDIKFFMDGDKDYTTIVGTGTEDYLPHRSIRYIEENIGPGAIFCNLLR